MVPLEDSNGTSTRDNAYVELVGSDGTAIGNVSDRVKVDIQASGSSVAAPMINRQDASTTVTASGNTSGFETSGMACLNFQLYISAISGTSPTLQLELEASDDNSNWAHFYSTARITTTGYHRVPGLRISGWYYRYRWIVTGTSPSITFAIQSTLKAYLPKRSTVLVRYADLDLTTINNVSSVFTSGDTSNVSMQMIRADDGGSNAAVRIQVSNDNVNWDDLTGANITIARATSTLQTVSSHAWRYFRIKVVSASNAGTRVVDMFWGANS
jgi:hypothetical protein